MNYSSLISSISEAHHRTVTSASRALNQYHIMRNWLIGAYLIEFEQNGEDRATYGAGLLKRVSADLAAQKISGCSRQMLERMRQLYLQYPQLFGQICSPLLSIFGEPPLKEPKCSTALSISASAKTKSPTPLPATQLLRLSWSHFIELIRLGNVWQRAFYENECLRGNWPIRHLQRQIGTQLFERTAMSPDKQAAINRDRLNLSDAPASVAELIRDPYVLEFTGLPERPDHLESDLEKAILDHLQAFLLELGEGFCFEARRYLTALPSPETIKALIERDQAMREQAQFQLPATP